MAAWLAVGDDLPALRHDVVALGAPVRAALTVTAAAILPGMAPGGVVIHGYSAADRRLLFVRAIPADVAAGDVDYAACDDAAEALARIAPGEGILLVAFDGDTGERMAWPPT